MDAQEKMYLAAGVATATAFLVLLLLWLLARSKRETITLQSVIDQLNLEMDLKRLKEALGSAFARYAGLQKGKDVVERFRYPLDNEKYDLPGLLPLAKRVYAKHKMFEGTHETFARFVYFLRGPGARQQLEIMLASDITDEDWFHWTLELAGEKTIRSSLMS